ncbi:ATP-binding cassette domain-containing protein [Fulvivirgaceae bacterium PWU4]|uniref:ATP-binding cassette domain-containing protein n=1 Tax=Chryseosolibacter histidini TaxID=2782349 RepID=A0AAP2DUU8_9BACT|nr:ATP-binding cassette domain-containing protein [Chryseosolibacter histidini]MBT1701397.1 ATP-binding cassette domain-containing protein [Chryseosolibacter histidini]
MSEELLKAIIQLFAIVARERITEDERTNVKEFLSLHLNREATAYYLKLFDELSHSHKIESAQDLSSLDIDTQQFVDDWAKIMQIVKQVNQALTMQQKMVLVVKIIELVHADRDISDRQGNLIFYIGQALKIPKGDMQALKSFVTGQDIDELASRNVLIIDEGSDEKPYPGPRIVEKNLTGLIAILRVPDAETYFIKYLGITTLYLNSILLKSRKVDIFPTGSTIRGDKIESIYYSDVVGRFLTGESTSHITFTADHLFYHFKSGRAGLQNVNIAEQGGKLIGLMGASGSGKSTLLNVLNGTEKPSSGRVLINGIDIHEQPNKVQGIIGYIPQDDLLIEDLTVFENLYYAARLCFGHYSKEETNKLTEQVLLNLGLTEIRNLKVGSPLQKTISGGQRKRLNIGLELLREPAILFVDEPTSGLSSRDSENIMDLLKELSLRGKMVFVVIHQPSSDIFKMFDTLIIMDSGGFQIYYGNPVDAVIYFRDVINAANKSQGACPECGNINPEQVFSIIETKVVNEYGRLTNTRKISPGQWYQYFKQKVKLPRIQHVREELPVVQEIPNWYKQLKVFITRDVLAKLANTQYLYINLFEAPVLAFFIAFMVKYYNVLEGEDKYVFYNNHNIPVYFFMSVVVALFFGLTMSAEEIFRDRKILKREQFLHLSRSSYLTSKVAVMFSISAIQTILFILVGNAVLQIPLTELRYWLILFSCTCFANMLGLNISASFNSAVTIYILIPLLIIPQLLLSGVVISFDKFNPKVGKPVGIPVMGEIMASRWAFEAYMVTQFKDNPFEKQFYDLDKVIAQSEYRRVYFIPALESRLAYCLNNRAAWRNPRNAEMTGALALLQNEIRYELQKVGEDKFPDINRLAIGKFDSSVYVKTNQFLTTLKQYYANRLNRAAGEKEKLIAQMTSTPERKAAFEASKAKYVNEAVTDAVKNMTNAERIVSYDGELIQKIYPIYMDEHRPEHAFDFSASLYQPVKHFLGFNIDTLYFNIAVIWSMTVVLFVTLYFDGLKRLIKLLEGNRKYRRRDRQ